MATATKSKKSQTKTTKKATAPKRTRGVSSAHVQETLASLLSRLTLLEDRLSALEGSSHAAPAAPSVEG